MENIDMSFAGFIMTYNRPEILRKTINTILNQTYPPSKLIIVDNSDNNETKVLIESLNFKNLNYVHTGSNAGPAGAAYLGLKLLVEEGYKWIYWGDDDDPPLFPDVFQHLLKLAININNLGAIGSVGSKFNYNTGLRERFKDNECKGLLECDSIGGNHNLIINADAVSESAVYPNPDLFFGFEEFEFLQRLKNCGFKIYVSGDSLLEHRKLTNRLGISSTRTIIPTKMKKHLKRDYYSYRNLIYTLFYSFDNKKLGLKVAFRAIAKVPIGFYNGWDYGYANTLMMNKAVYHAFSKKLGKRI